MKPNDLHYELLRELAVAPAASQRSLAGRLGISVGKLNYCMRALVAKGWVKASNFRRSDNKLAYAYLLTPAGMTAKVRLMKDFLRRKENEYELLQAEIATLRVELAQVSEPSAESSTAPGAPRQRNAQRSKT